MEHLRQSFCAAASFAVTTLATLPAVFAPVSVPDNVAALVLLHLCAAVNAPVIRGPQERLAEVRQLAHPLLALYQALCLWRLEQLLELGRLRRTHRLRRFVRRTRPAVAGLACRTPRLRSY